MGKAKHKREKAKKRKDAEREEDLLEALGNWTTESNEMETSFEPERTLPDVVFESGNSGKKKHVSKKAKRNKKKNKLLAEKSIARDDMLQQKLLQIVQKKSKKEKWSSIY
jgi:hypothetical protein